MSEQNLYQHKKFTVKSDNYNHKKFAKHTNKRQHKDLEENLVPITAQTILDLTAKEVTQPEQPLPKRKQTKALFRPWLDQTEKKAEAKTTPLNPINNIVVQEPLKQIKKLEQQKRIHLNAQNHQHKQLADQVRLQQQYNAYQYYQAAIVQQNIAQAVYLRQLQQLALRRQGQLFVFGQQ